MSVGILIWLALAPALILFSFTCVAAVASLTGCNDERRSQFYDGTNRSSSWKTHDQKARTNNELAPRQGSFAGTFDMISPTAQQALRQLSDKPTTEILLALRPEDQSALLANAQAMLQLRVARANNLWDRYWSIAQNCPALPIAPLFFRTLDPAKVVTYCPALARHRRRG